MFNHRVPAAQDIQRASKRDFEEAVKAGLDFVLIDARSGPAYESSHLELKGARRIDPQHAAANLDHIPGGRPIFTVCT